jgi:hypothetical protein
MVIEKGRPETKSGAAFYFIAYTCLRFIHLAVGKGL